MTDEQFREAAVEIATRQGKLVSDGAPLDTFLDMYEFALRDIFAKGLKTAAVEVPAWIDTDTLDAKMYLAELCKMAAEARRGGKDV